MPGLASSCLRARSADAKGLLERDPRPGPGPLLRAQEASTVRCASAPGRRALRSCSAWPGSPARRRADDLHIRLLPAARLQAADRRRAARPGGRGRRLQRRCRSTRSRSGAPIARTSRVIVPYQAKSVPVRRRRRGRGLPGRAVLRVSRRAGRAAGPAGRPGDPVQRRSRRSHLPDPEVVCVRGVRSSRRPERRRSIEARSPAPARH